MWEPAPLCPGHGDINPGNLLFDGTQLWLIDWAAARGESLLRSRSVAPTPSAFAAEAMETAFLTACFERTLTADETAVYAHMRVFCGIYYGLIFLYMSGLQGTPLLYG
ncbi:MAG: hypothetical protein R2867_20455 [Caldilineaceae bacterium]